MRWEEYVTRIENINTQKLMVGKSEGKIPLNTPLEKKYPSLHPWRQDTPYTPVEERYNSLHP
jgi:hypothetical protein